MLGKTLRKLDETIGRIEEWSLFIIVIVALISLFFNVVLRYGFNYTLAWSEELVRIVIIYSTFIGASVAIKQRAMIRIDAIVQIFPKLKKGLTFLYQYSDAGICSNDGFLWVQDDTSSAHHPPENHYHADSPGDCLRNHAGHRCDAVSQDCTGDVSGFFLQIEKGLFNADK